MNPTFSALIFGVLLVLRLVEAFSLIDEIAQGPCAALLPEADSAYAVKRECTSSSIKTCSTVCSELGKVCFNSLHFYSSSRSYKYNSCASNYCGPNICCCSDRTPPSSSGYKDKIAQATCTAAYPVAGYVSAVRRQCSSDTGACEAVCKNLGKACFESLHIYSRNLNQTETGSVGLRTYRYKSCVTGGCGPNFCCCSGK